MYYGDALYLLKILHIGNEYPCVVGTSKIRVSLIIFDYEDTLTKIKIKIGVFLSNKCIYERVRGLNSNEGEQSPTRSALSAYQWIWLGIAWGTSVFVGTSNRFLKCQKYPYFRS